MIRVAVIEANHWHAPLYLDAFRSPGIEVVAVSDAENGLGRRMAEQLGCRHYASYEELLAQGDRGFRLRVRPAGRHAEASVKHSSTPGYRT